MDHGLEIEKNEALKTLRPGSYWQEFTVHVGKTLRDNL